MTEWHFCNFEWQNWCNHVFRSFFSGNRFFFFPQSVFTFWRAFIVRVHPFCWFFHKLEQLVTFFAHYLFKFEFSVLFSLLNYAFQFVFYCWFEFYGQLIFVCTDSLQRMKWNLEINVLFGGFCYFFVVDLHLHFNWRTQSDFA